VSAGGRVLLYPRRTAQPMERKAVWLLLLMLLPLLATVPAQAAERTSYEAGHAEWTVDDTLRLFVEGLDAEEAVLQRNGTDGTVGGFTLAGGSGEVQVFSLTSAPLVQPINGTVNLSAFFSVHLVNAPTRACSFGVARPTVLRMEAQAGSASYSSTVEQVVEAVIADGSDLFQGERVMLDIDMDVGDTFGLTLWMDHTCGGTQARVLWGGFEQNAGGLVIEGDVYEPRATLKVDAARHAHIEFYAELPWGADDIAWKDGGPSVAWWLWGPLDADELTTMDGDLLAEESTGRVMITRELAGNGTAWTWTGSERMPLGHVTLELCITVVGSDPNEDCHVRGFVRAVVEGPDEGWANSAVWLTITTAFAFVGFIAHAFRQGVELPLPILGALLLLSLAMLPLAFVQDNLGAEAVVHDNIRIGDPSMVSSSESILAPTDVLGEADVMLVSVLLPGSENAADHVREFDTAVGAWDGDVALLMVVIGDDALPSDAEAYAERFGLTWPVLLDATGEFASSLPTGEADAVLIVDRTGRVSASSTPGMAASDLVEAMDDSQRGGAQSGSTYLRLAFGPCLFLLFLALPRVGWTQPEEPLPPGTLWLSIVAVSGLGVVLVNLPSMLLALLPLDAALSSTLDLVIFLWFLEMAIVAAVRGEPFESSILGRLVHRSTPAVFRNWRDVEDLSRDLLLGVWVGWFAWFVEPAIFAQGVGAAVLSGPAGVVFGLANALLFAFSGGMVVLLLRLVAALGGPLSRLFGLYGAESFARFTGWVMVPLGLWVTFNHLLLLVELGIF
jgi:hypothetical protein